MAARWGGITAGEIVASIKGEIISGRDDLIFKGLSTDSRHLKVGDLFWALRGERFDGHDYVRQAVEKGAAGVAIEKGEGVELFQAENPSVIGVRDTLKALGDLAGWWRQQHGNPVAAITGSTGKTTTKEMTAQIFEVGGRTLKNRGNFNNLIGLPLTLLSMEDAHRRVVLEMGMNRAGEIGRLTEIADPNVGLITNVARAHLEGLGDIRGVARAKVELLEKISSGSQVILNGDDELLLETASSFNRSVTTFGMKAENDIRARKIKNMGSEGFSFELEHHGKVIPVRLGVPGYQNIYNAMASSAIALCLNEPPENIIEGLSRFQGVKGRFMLTRLEGGIMLVDDTYNSNPYSLRVAINSLRDLTVKGGRVIVGLGEMMELGDETVSAHLEAGGMVAELGVSYFVAIGSHAEDLVKGAMNQGLPSERTAIVDTHREMARKLWDVLETGDIIFLKGSRIAGLEKVVEWLKRKSRKEG